MKKYLLLISILLFFLGCRDEPPPDSAIKDNLIQYLQSVNLPLQIDAIEIFNKGFKKSLKSYDIEIAVKGKILSEDKNNILHIINNRYKGRFNHIVYGYWRSHFDLIKNPPPDSVIYALSVRYFSIDQTQIKILHVDSMDRQEKFYPVNISINKVGTDSFYSLPFSQDEFGIWKIGINELIKPESTVKAFLSEVNNGTTELAKRYFSYDYKLGFDDLDKKNLEQLFPKGSIKNILVKDVFTNKDTTRLHLLVAKTSLDTFKTDLELIKFGIEWRIRYDGWDWKFKK